MRISLLLLIVCAGLLCIPPAPPSPVIAQDKPAAANPFNENMNWEEAEATMAKAVDGDEEAEEKISAGRLSWVPMMSQSRFFMDTLQWRHELLGADIEWVRSFQKWEAILSGSDPAAIATGYKERLKQFRHAQPQLARAIIKLWLLGDENGAAQLAKGKTDDPWVKAAYAWLGVDPDPRKCVDDMQALLAQVIEFERYTIGVYPGLLDPDLRHEGFASNAYCQGEVSLMFGTDGIQALPELPWAWRNRGFVERLGVRISELPTSRDREAAIEKAAEALGSAGSENYNYRALIAAARPDDPTDGVPVPGGAGQNSRGPLLRAHALSILKDYPISSRLSAIACFEGQPDWQPAQRDLLHEAGLSRDPVFARLAARAVLALNDDQLAAIVSVARSVGETALLTQEAAAFRKALEAIEQDSLQAVTAAMRGKGEFPQVHDRRPLGLSVEQRASLLGVFADPLELESSGSEVAVFWMSIAHFQMSRVSPRRAVISFCKAVEATQKAAGRKWALTITGEARRELHFMAGLTGFEPLLKTVEKDYPDAVTAIRRDVELHSDNPPSDADAKELAMLALEKAAIGGDPLTDEQRELLEGDPLCCGGWHRMMMGYALKTDGDWVERERLWRLADLTSPCDFDNVFVRQPPADQFLRYRYRNWFEALHLAQCGSLLRPYMFFSIAKLASVAARAGEPARALNSLLMQAGDRSLVPYYWGAQMYSAQCMQFAREGLATHLNRLGGALGSSVGSGWVDAYKDALISTVWGYDLEDNIKRVTLGGRRGAYLLTCYDYEMQRRGGARKVNMILNMSLSLAASSPEVALKLVDSAEAIGVSKYGRFVASQTYIRGQAHLGEYDSAMKRYKELREGDYGYPPYLDDFLLAGLLEGNQYEHMGDALDEIAKHDVDLTWTGAQFITRCALMAAGRHLAVAKVEAPNGSTTAIDTYNLNPYSPLFHEARALLDQSKPQELLKRAYVYWDEGIEASVGVFLDSFLLAGLAAKLIPQSAGNVMRKDGRLQIIGPRMPADFMPSPWLLDTFAMRILSGEEPVDALPPMDDSHVWHGTVFSERPPLHDGGGFLTDGQAVARDHFVRGVIAFLADDTKTARTELTACVDCNERCSHEYHVAEWLLEKQIPKDK